MNINDKLIKNHYQPGPAPAHIIVSDIAQQTALNVLLNACPAGLYRQNAQSDISFDAHGCLECGTCRILCDDETFARWQYPPAGFGVTFRFG